MIIRTKSTVFCCALLLCAFLKCTSGSGDPLAGGSGSGNPGGGYTTLSLFVDTSATGNLQKTIAQAPAQPSTGGPQTGRQRYSVHDASGMVLTIDSVVIIAQHVSFALDYLLSCDSLLAGFDTSLHCGYSGMSIKGPIQFNCLARSSVPALGFVKLPIASYTGVVFHISIDTTQPGIQSTTSAADSAWPIFVHGSFTYLDTLRSFFVRCSLNMAIPFRSADSGFTVSQGDTTDLSVVFDCRDWFAGMNLKESLDNRDILLDSQGNLIIDDTQATGPGSNVVVQIRNNLIGSGRLGVNRR